MAQQAGVQEQQRNAVLKMLSLQNGAGDIPSGPAGQTWKVFVYDKFCQEVVAPLLKIGGLRKHGVTMHLNINSKRNPLTDVPAVYFVEPTEANVKKICEDLTAGLYESCYVNFASAVPRSLLEELATGTARAGAGQKVSGVFDRYVSFVSLSKSCFSLNLPAAYETIHSPLADQMIEQYVERIVDGLLSFIITTRQMPVIRCKPGHCAEMVGRRLDERIRELLSRGGAAAAELFAGTSGPSQGNTQQRLLLCVLDRDIDLVTMLGHTWTYQAMVQDVLGMRLNQLNIPVDESSGSGPPKMKSYDVDDSDKFWVAHAGEPFPEVASAVHEAIEEFNKQRADVTKNDDGGDPAETLGPGLAAAINALPEMTERKRSIDMHTNLATALLNEVKARSLDRYFEVEDQINTQSTGASVKALDELISDSNAGTLMDKTRALMVLSLSKSLTPEQHRKLTDKLSAAGGDLAAISYLQHLANMNSMMNPSATTSAPAASGSSGGGLMGALASRLAGAGENVLAAGMSGIKNIVASKKELAVCKILDALMDHKEGKSTDNYLYLDPKAPPAAYGQEQTRIRAPFKRATAFVVGGGNYTEMQSLQEWALEKGKEVSYGSTDLVSPSQFVEELSHLGQGQDGGSSAPVDLS